MALTANRDVQRYVDQELRSFSVAESAHIFKGAIVGFERTTGHVRPLVAGDLFAGIAYEECDNSSGAAGAVSVRLYTQGDFILPVSGISAASVGSPAYASNDTSLSVLAAPGGSSAGKVITYLADSTAIVRIEPFFMPLVEQTAHVPLVSSTSAATTNPVLIATRAITLISVQVVFNTKPDAGVLDVGTDNTTPNQIVSAFSLPGLTNHVPASPTMLAFAVAKGARVWAKVGQATSTAGVGGLLSVRYVEVP